MRMRLMRSVHVLPVFMILCCLAGCDINGQNGGDIVVPDGSEDQLTTVYNRTLEVGDTWTYEVEETTSASGETSRTIGTSVVEVAGDGGVDLMDNPTMVVTEIFNGEVNELREVTKSIAWYLSQDSYGTVYQHGRLNGYVNPAESRYVNSPSSGRYSTLVSPIAVGDVKTWDVEFDDGSTLSGRSVVASVEDVEVGAGNFTAAKIEVTETEITADARFEWEYTLWHVPEIGRDVKAEFDVIVEDGRGGVLTSSHRMRELAELSLVEPDVDTNGLDDTNTNGVDASTNGVDATTNGEVDSGSDEGGIPAISEDLEAVVTDSGLMYYDIEVGTGDQPTEDGAVVVDYVGYLEDGTVFDSGEGVTFTLDSVIEGFSEGIQTMSVGGSRRLIIPPDLGYGENGNSGAGIGGDDTIVFDVTLVDLG